jgi:hypothetical protein
MMKTAKIDAKGAISGFFKKIGENVKNGEK